MLPDPKTTLNQATVKAWTLLDEFKAFAFRGNVVDLAIGVIIGGVFLNLVDSLVKNLIMPLIAILIPGERPYTLAIHGPGEHGPHRHAAGRHRPLSAHLRDHVPLPREVPGLADAAQEAG
jgi:hypothetical protein